MATGHSGHGRPSLGGGTIDCSDQVLSRIAARSAACFAAVIAGPRICRTRLHATIITMRLWGRSEMTMNTRFMVAAGFSVLATMVSASPAWAKWGCAARSPANYWSNSYNDNTKAEASTEALKGCQDAGGKGCRIISCSVDINTEEQGNAMGSPHGPTTTIIGRRPAGRRLRPALRP
jgi:hypothetical protein